MGKHRTCKFFFYFRRFCVSKDFRRQAGQRMAASFCVHDCLRTQFPPAYTMNRPRQ
ncbi:MAG: zinc-finger domain-containing protein [Desulfovibrionaceae bacterium]|nr:zinc-finger domain-containing protein [Desulfovibrionaceae bacterium]